MKFLKKLKPVKKLDWLFITPTNTDKWILGAICREIAERIDGSYEIIARKGNGKDKDTPLPLAKNYFFTHYFLYTYYADKKLKGRKVIFFTHIKESEYSFQQLAAMFNQATLIAFQNKVSADYFIAAGLKPKKASIAIGGADPEFFQAHPRTGKGKIGFVSSYYDRKNPELIFEIIKAMPERQFMLIGKDWEKFGKFAELIAFKNLEYITASYKDYPALYAQMDVFVSPSTLEGGPIPLLETMMCNIVPVISDTGCARDLVRHGENGFIFPIDAKVAEVTKLIEKAYDIKVDTRKDAIHLSWDNFAAKVIGKKV